MKYFVTLWHISLNHSYIHLIHLSLSSCWKLDMHFINIISDMLLRTDNWTLNITSPRKTLMSIYNYHHSFHLIILSMSHRVLIQFFMILASPFFINICTFFTFLISAQHHCHRIHSWNNTVHTVEWSITCPELKLLRQYCHHY